MQFQIMTEANQEAAYDWLIADRYGRSNAYTVVYLSADPVAICMDDHGAIVAVAMCMADGSCTEWRGDLAYVPALLFVLLAETGVKRLSCDEADFHDLSIVDEALQLGFGRHPRTTEYRLTEAAAVESFTRAVAGNTLVSSGAV